jgi:DNA-binding CsgD family transcriptional regulator
VRARLDFSRVVLEIQAATFDPDRWISIMETLAKSVRAESAVLVTPTAEVNRGLTAAYEIDESLFAVYPQYAPYDLWTLEGRKQGLHRAGAVVDHREHIDSRHFYRSLFYNEWLKPQNIEFNLCAVPWGDDQPTEAPLTVLNFFRGVGEEPFGWSERRLLQRVIPHISAAIRGFWRMESIRLHDALKTRALDDINAALWILDGARRVVFANTKAEALVRRGEWITYRDSCLAPGSDIMDPVSVCFAPNAGTGFASQVIQRRSDLARAILNCSVLPESCRPAVAKPSHAVVWLVPLRVDHGPLDLAVRLFRLTPAEARLLALLAQGENLVRCAAILGRSHHTARMQLRSVFAKTGQHSQSGLCALVSRLSVVVPRD